VPKQLVSAVYDMDDHSALCRGGDARNHLVAALGAGTP
jgi:hypothetical protein